MKKIFSTNPHNTAALIARITVGIVIFPHGAQKLLGWFGGSGFNGTMGFLTGGAHLPWIIALLVILIESIGSIMLITGFATRIAALGMLVNFLGILFTVNIKNGFFMNWYAQPNKQEGYEFALLVIGLSLLLLVVGGGRWSADAALTSSHKNESLNNSRDII